MEKEQHRDMMKLLSESEIEKKINKLRSKLNKAFESNVDTREIVNISQELDKYIVFQQQKLIEKIKDK